jgi:hypothetical protein
MDSLEMQRVGFTPCPTAAQPCLALETSANTAVRIGQPVNIAS